MNAKGQLGNGERCVEADKQGVKLVFCRLGTVDGPWHYDPVCVLLFEKKIFSETTDLKFSTIMLQKSTIIMHTLLRKCLAVHPQNQQLVLLHCDPINTYQQWIFKEIVPKWK